MQEFEVPGLTKEEMFACMHSAFKDAILDLLEYKDAPYSTSFRQDILSEFREAVYDAMTFSLKEE